MSHLVHLTPAKKKLSGLMDSLEKYVRLSLGKPVLKPYPIASYLVRSARTKLYYGADLLPLDGWWFAAVISCISLTWGGLPYGSKF